MANKRSFPVFGLVIVVAVIGYSFVSKTNRATSSSAPDPEATVAVPVELGNQSGSSAKELDAMKKQGYVLSFMPDFDPGMAAIDDLGLSIVIAMDISGSMDDVSKTLATEKKYVQASKALGEIVLFLEQFWKERLSAEKVELKLGVLAFNAKVKTVFPMASMEASAFRTLRDLATDPRNFAPGGQTAIGRALEQGAKMLSQSGTIFKSIIVISDGENTEGTDPKQVLDAIYANRNDATTDDFPVLTSTMLASFVGFDLDIAAFEKLATSGARVMAASDREELSAALKSIFVADISRLEAGMVR